MPQVEYLGEDIDSIKPFQPKVEFLGTDYQPQVEFLGEQLPTEVPITKPTIEIPTQEIPTQVEPSPFSARNLLNLKGESTLVPSNVSEKGWEIPPEQRKPLTTETVAQGVLDFFTKPFIERMPYDPNNDYAENVKTGLMNTMASMAEAPALIAKFPAQIAYETLGKPLQSYLSGESTGEESFRQAGVASIEQAKGLVNMLISGIPGLDPQWTENLFMNPDTVVFGKVLARDVARGTVRTVNDVVDKAEAWKAQRAQIPDQIAQGFKGSLATMYQARRSQYEREGKTPEEASFMAFKDTSETIDGQSQTRTVLEDTLRKQVEESQRLKQAEEADRLKQVEEAEKFRQEEITSKEIPVKEPEVEFLGATEKAPIENENVYKEIRQNEGIEAEKLVRNLNKNGIITVDTHVTGDKITVQIHADESMLNKIADTGVILEKRPSQTGIAETYNLRISKDQVDRIIKEIEIFPQAPTEAKAIEPTIITDNYGGEWEVTKEGRFTFVKNVETGERKGATHLTAEEQIKSINVIEIANKIKARFGIKASGMDIHRMAEEIYNRSLDPYKVEFKLEEGKYKVVEPVPTEAKPIEPIPQKVEDILDYVDAQKYKEDHYHSEIIPLKEEVKMLSDALEEADFIDKTELVSLFDRYKEIGEKTDKEIGAVTLRNKLRDVYYGGDYIPEKNKVDYEQLLNNHKDWLIKQGKLKEPKSIPEVKPEEIKAEVPTESINKSHLEFIRDRITASEPPKRAFAEGEVKQVEGYPEWFRGKGFVKNITITAIDKAIEGKELTSKQQDIIDSLMEGSLKEYQKIGKIEIDPSTMKQGDKMVINGEIYEHKGFDEKTGDIIIENDIKHKLDIGDTILVDKVLPKESFLKPSEAKKVKTTPIQKDMFGATQEGLEGKLISKELPKETELEKATREAEVRKAETTEDLFFNPAEEFKRRETEKGTTDEESVRRSDIVKFLQDKLDIPIRVGRFRERALGIFKPKEEIVRTKLANDIEVIAHEIGHGLHKFLWGRTAEGLSGKPLKDFKDELEPMATKPRAGQENLPEGFAEFVRLYITDAEKAKNTAPKFFDHFEKLLDEKSPESKEIFLEARQMYERWLKQPALARVLGHISVGEGKEGRSMSQNFTDLYTRIVDELHPLKKAVEEMLGQKKEWWQIWQKGKEVPEIQKDPYKLARLMSGFWGKADAWLDYKPYDFKTYKWLEGRKPLREILEPVRNNLDEFRAYIVSKRALEYYEKGKESGILKEDAQEIVNKYDSKYSETLKDLTQYRRDLLTYIKDAGLVDLQGYLKIQMAWENNVPFYRVFEESQRGVGTGKGFEAWQPVKKVKGSWRDIVDPLESIVKDTYLFINMAEKNAIGTALVDLAKSKEGMGKWVEKIPESMQRIIIKEPELFGILSRYGKWTETTKVKELKETVGEKITQVGEGGEEIKGTAADKVEKVAKEALTARGYSEPEATQILTRIKNAKTPEARSQIIERTIERIAIVETTKEFGLDLPNNVAELFRPSAFQPTENVIGVWKNGKKELYQVHPEIARAIKALDRENLNAILKILSIPARWLRVGATTLSPEFVARNPIRDQWTAFCYSKYGFIPGVDLVKGVFHIANATDMYWKWKISGGEHSMLVSLDRDYLQKQLDDVLRSRKLLSQDTAMYIVKHPIEALRIFSEFGEAGTRIGEFEKGIKKEGITKEGIQKSGFASQEITLPFSRRGTYGKTVNSIVAFWNANVQGIDKMARAFKDNPLETSIKVLASVTIPSITLALLNREDARWEEIPRWQKDLFWIVMPNRMPKEKWNKMTSSEKADWLSINPDKSGIYRIPKPFELGILFGSVPERITDYILTKNPKAFKDILKSVATGASPGFLPTAIQPVIENLTNYSFFFERDIVPKGMEELLPQFQYQPYTTDTAKMMGKVMSKIPLAGETWMASPAKIENLIRGWSGGFGQLMMQTADKGLQMSGIAPKEVKPSATLSDYPMIKGFVVRYPTANAQSITDFYESYDKASQIINTTKQLMLKGKMDEAKEVFTSGDILKLDRTRVALRNAHKVVDMVFANPQIKPEEKKKMIDTIYLEMIAIARQGNDVLERGNKIINEKKKSVLR